MPVASHTRRRPGNGDHRGRPSTSAATAAVPRPAASVYRDVISIPNCSHKTRYRCPPHRPSPLRAGIASDSEATIAGRAVALLDANHTLGTNASAIGSAKRPRYAISRAVAERICRGVCKGALPGTSLSFFSRSNGRSRTDPHFESVAGVLRCYHCP